jgi:hypothetical protein
MDMHWKLTGRTDGKGSLVRVEAVCGLCGTVKWVYRTHIRHGRSKSCGCMRGVRAVQSPPQRHGFAVRLADATCRWAKGDAIAPNPWVWGASAKEAPTVARLFSTKQEALSWVADRTRYRETLGRDVPRCLVLRV